MEKVLVGYYIDSHVHFELQHKKIIRFDSKGKQLRCFVLRETMMRLFIYLLENASDNIVTNEQILYNVWDIYGLKSSSQRLWQVMQALKYRLAVLNVPHDFIMRVDTFEVKGYCLKKDMIRPLYFFTSDV
ncbi:winged helix-turn-helix domain-containing protein [Yokenella regensburgei]|uniref:winged helix-turn-helix domain-containing protein n=1 Tax=Yokenella regensburgei TaxID=158877 RepID=UPI0014331F1B|nr:hypothetical protein [Yokenella regensburgei]QIU88429.1 hypothetical protein HEC60_03160 [Yokenella regensburgei]